MELKFFVNFISSILQIWEKEITINRNFRLPYEQDFRCARILTILVTFWFLLLNSMSKVTYRKKKNLVILHKVVDNMVSRSRHGASSKKRQLHIFKLLAKKSQESKVYLSLILPDITPTNIFSYFFKEGIVMQQISLEYESLRDLNSFCHHLCDIP